MLIETGTQIEHILKLLDDDSPEIQKIVRSTLLENSTDIVFDDLVSKLSTSKEAHAQLKTTLQDLHFVPVQEEITIEDFKPGQNRAVSLHDGSQIHLRKIDRDYDPTSRRNAINLLEEARLEDKFVTGLIYISQERSSLQEVLNLVDTPLAHLPAEQLRPSSQALADILQGF